MGNESGELVRTGEQRRWLVLMTEISDIKAVFLKVLFEFRNGLVCRYDRLGVLLGLMGIVRFQVLKLAG